MRPSLLFPLFSNLTSLYGVGEKNRLFLEKLDINRIIDLLFHFPANIIDRRHMPAITHATSGQVITCVVKVEDHAAPTSFSRKATPYKVHCANDTGILSVNFFNARPEYIQKQLPVGEVRVISGRVERFGHEIHITHPDYIAPIEQLETIRKVEPVYPLTAGISNKLLTKLILQALQKVPTLPEWIDPFYLKKQQWLPWHQAVATLHHPESNNDLLMHCPSRMRLAYDELLANQLALQLTRNHITRSKGIGIQGNGALQQALLASLGFTLTEGQQQVIHEITTDQASEYRMLRLLQGDVGSGKTVVALMAMLNSIEAGTQAALMAPTEILARQHYEWISKVTKPLNLYIAVLTGKTKSKERQEILEQLKAGHIHIIIGTHALFQEEVEFKHLSLAVIDEQHRFGVEQRMKLAEKGKLTDILLMTATPIPRTLAMTAFGDMDCSQLTDKPKGRKTIITRTVPLTRISEVIERLQSIIQQNRQSSEKPQKIYWICPLVEESEKSDLAAAEARYEEFKRYFGSHVGLVHGKMKPEQRDEVMLAFRDSDVDILIATTVVEVGVDVPDATIIVIEHAERFGLAQLHQLRGRVGRNDKQSSCILLYNTPLGTISTARLTMMRESNDGFAIAEEDLRLRGSGDVLGTKQSGLPSFKLADITEHGELLRTAHQDAKYILNQDPNLTSPRGQALKLLLHLFEYDHHIRYVQSG